MTAARPATTLHEAVAIVNVLVTVLQAASGLRFEA